MVKINPIAPTPPEEKFDFWSPQKFSLNRFQSIQRIRKRPPGHVLGLPRDRGQRNSPQKMNSFLGQNKNSFVRALFVLKNDSQVTFSTRRGPKRLKRVKNVDFKIWSKLVNIGPIALPPPEEKFDFWTPQNFNSIGSNRFSVSENVPRDTF